MRHHDFDAFDADPIRPDCHACNAEAECGRCEACHEHCSGEDSDCASRDGRPIEVFDGEVEVAFLKLARREDCPFCPASEAPVSEGWVAIGLESEAAAWVPNTRRVGCELHRYEAVQEAKAELDRYEAGLNARRALEAALPLLVRLEETPARLSAEESEGLGQAVEWVEEAIGLLKR